MLVAVAVEVILAPKVAAVPVAAALDQTLH
jgi:hypothetical protein